MRAIFRKPWKKAAFCLAVVLALGEGRASRAAETIPPTLAISGMTAEGSNLVLTASIPPGLQSVSLDTRPSLQAPWEQFSEQDAPANGGEIVFTYPRADDEESRFFRLRGSPLSNASNAAPAALVSGELEFVAVASLTEGQTNGSAVFHFRGRVDGSDRILITHSGAFWEHINWSYPPEPVEVNGAKWDPAQKNYMATVAPAKFLPDSFSLDSAELQKIKGRDVVALERIDKGLMVYLDDTHLAAGEYEFVIIFQPLAAEATSAPKTASTPARLTLSGWISGSDVIKITPTEATWEHKTFDWPQNVMLNGAAWAVRKSPVMTNDGATQFLPAGVDFSTVKVVSRKGRDLATAWGTKNALWIHFADNPNGSDQYEIQLAFGAQ